MDSVRQQVLDAAAWLVDAFGAGDVERYFGCFAPDASFIFHNHDAALPDTSSYRALWQRWEEEFGFQVVGCKSSDQRVQSFGDLVVFTHSVATNIRTNDGEATTFERETIVFVKRGDRWVAVHEHLSPMQKG